MPRISQLSTGTPASTSDIPLNVGSTTVRANVQLVLSAPLTAQGQITYADSSAQTTRLAVPTSGAVLTYSSGSSVPTWSIPTSGAVLIGSSNGVPTWRAIGTSGQIFQTTGGSPAWVNTTAVLAETLTAAGDMLIRSTAGIERLAPATSGAVLTYSTVAGTERPSWSVPTSGSIMAASSLIVPEWLAAPSSGAILSYSTGSTRALWTSVTSGGVLIGSAANVPSFLAPPTSGAVLTFSSGSSIPAWSVPTSGAIFIASSISVPTWLAIGTSGQFLQTTGGRPTWVAAPGGGSSAINLPAAAWEPTANASSFASAQLTVVQSAGSVPSARWQEWLFDATTAEYVVATFLCPPNYTGSPSINLRYYSTAAVSSGVAWSVRTAGLATSGPIASWAYVTTADQTTVTLPTTANDLGTATIALTEGSSVIAAGRLINLALWRNVAATGDAAAGDMHFVGAEFTYS